MKKSINSMALFLSMLLLICSCASSTMIRTIPAGGKLYLNGEYAGITPYKHRDTKIVGSTTDVRIEMEGYEVFYGYFSRNEKADVGAIIGGVFLLFPFIWTMKYKPERTYELKPISTDKQ